MGGGSDMSESILNSVKHALSLGEDYTVFDQDIILYINSVFTTLNQLGVGPIEGFAIQDSSVTWDAFLGDDPRLNNVLTFVVLNVRLLFDPPTTSYGITAFESQIEQLAWRITVKSDSDQWTDPEILEVEL
jgi:hypothetical protein